MYNRMKKGFCLALLMAVMVRADAQSVSSKLAAAFGAFEKDAQLKNGLASIYVLDAATGKVVFEKAGRIGLAPASTQKIITAATAYDMLGKDFRYETKFGFTDAAPNDNLSRSLIIQPSGDPTLGSWRWQSTSEEAVVKRLATAMNKAGVSSFHQVTFEEDNWQSERLPGGWIWDDIGNYYGAGAGAFNWRENQYDLILRSGKNIGDSVSVTGTKPHLYHQSFVSYVTSAAKGTGDNSYIYFSVTGTPMVVRGTIPVNEDRFVIAGAMPDAPAQFISTVLAAISSSAETSTTTPTISRQKAMGRIQYFHTEPSPPLDSLSYWFLKKSINLYGEALAKTLALKKGKIASAANGAQTIRNHWKEKGIGVDATELNMQDGSGLSPQNRVTTHAQVAVLQYAQKQPWFAGYLAGFPDYNGMKLKSGPIGGAKGFCGYHTSKDGKQYIVSFLVNNYNGSSASLVQKMYKVLDVLK